MAPVIDLSDVVPILRATMPSTMPELLGVYLFGSYAAGTQTGDSDVDLAVLVAGKTEPVALWMLAEQLASHFNRDIDLIDLRAASTVMQYEIIYRGRRLWAKDDQAALYESFILSEKTALDTFRAGIVADIEKSGRVYG